MTATKAERVAAAREEVKRAERAMDEAEETLNVARRAKEGARCALLKANVKWLAARQKLRHIEGEK